MPEQKFCFQFRAPTIVDDGNARLSDEPSTMRLTAILSPGEYPYRNTILERLEPSAAGDPTWIPVGNNAPAALMVELFNMVARAIDVGAVAGAHRVNEHGVRVMHLGSISYEET